MIAFFQQQLPQVTEKAAETLNRTEWGALVVILFIVLLTMSVIHYRERKEWRITIDANNKSNQEKTERFINVITELNTLIKQDQKWRN